MSAEATCTTPCPLCGAAESRQVAILRTRPPGETDFGIAPADYRRSIVRCASCSVFYSVHNLFSFSLYERDYNDAKYADRLDESYRRIRALPAERSDNKRRAQRVSEFLRSHWQAPEDTWVLDVGSGLCVFLGELKDLGFRGVCIDPDLRSVMHAVRNVGVDDGLVGTLRDVTPDQRFHLVTFNKVLEHVPDPVEQLRIAQAHLREGGAIYVEVPDGERALTLASVRDREEFFIEHLMVFDEPSLRYLATAAGLRCIQLESIHEPSDKCTLFAFLEPAS